MPKSTRGRKTRKSKKVVRGQSPLAVKTTKSGVTKKSIKSIQKKLKINKNGCILPDVAQRKWYKQFKNRWTKEGDAVVQKLAMLDKSQLKAHRHIFEKVDKGVAEAIQKFTNQLAEEFKLQKLKGEDTITIGKGQYPLKQVPEALSDASAFKYMKNWLVRNFTLDQLESFKYNPLRFAKQSDKFKINTAPIDGLSTIINLAEEIADKKSKEAPQEKAPKTDIVKQALKSEWEKKKPLNNPNIAKADEFLSMSF